MTKKKAEKKPAKKTKKKAKRKRGRPKKRKFEISVEVIHEYEFEITAATEPEAKREAIERVETDDCCPTSKHTRIDRCYEEHRGL